MHRKTDRRTECMQQKQWKRKRQLRRRAAGANYFTNELPTDPESKLLCNKWCLVCWRLKQCRAGRRRRSSSRWRIESERRQSDPGRVDREVQGGRPRRLGRRQTAAGRRKVRRRSAVREITCNGSINPVSPSHLWMVFFARRMLSSLLYC